MVSYCNLNFVDLLHTQMGSNSGHPFNVMHAADQEAALSTQNNTSSSSSSSPAKSPENIDLNGKLSRNRMDPNEVWREIVNQDHNNNGSNPFEQQQQSENTIEEFLVKAGGINLNPPPQPALMAIDPMVVVSQQQEDWFKFQVQQQQMMTTMPMQSVMESNFRVCEMDLGEIGQSESKVGLPLSMSMAPVSNCSDSLAGIDRKMPFADQMMEKTIERRRKRMIKNRESAARSRARKQAYTNQLEHEVLQLRNTNSWLKKHKEASKFLSKHSTSHPRYQLRRTSSSVF